MEQAAGPAPGTGWPDGVPPVAVWTCLAVATPVLLTLLYRLYRTRWGQPRHDGDRPRRPRHQPRWRQRPQRDARRDKHRPQQPQHEDATMAASGQETAAAAEETEEEEWEEDEEAPPHSWHDVELFGRPAFCCVCGQAALMHVSCCEACGLCAHAACGPAADRGPARCKARCAPSRGGRMRHLWVRGSVPLCAPCSACGAPCGAQPRLCDARCAWCQRCVHDGCRPATRGAGSGGVDGVDRDGEDDNGDGGGDEEECDLGPLRGVIIPPHTLHAALRQAALPGVDADWTPLLVLVNRRSGDGAAQMLLQQLRGLLNPVQVVDMSEEPPEQALALCALFPAHAPRVLVCGGDGTVGWALDAIDRLLEQGERVSRPPVAVLPLGTGNDLARSLGWGEGFPGDGAIDAWLADVRRAETRTLDRWRVQVTSRGYKMFRKHTKSLSMNNYFSVGPDALMALNFHRHRESTPALFTSRIVNKAVYFFYGTKDCLVQECRNLDKMIELELDGERVALPSLEGIIVLNIAHWGGGCRLWEGTGDAACPPASQDDGKLEVVGVYGSFHLAQLQVKLANPLRLGQARTVKLTLREGQMPMQVDGEPWSQGPCSVLITYKTAARVLARRGDGGGGETGAP